MTNKIEIARELAERIVDWYDGGLGNIIYEMDELRALLAAPVVERQEPVAYRWRHPADPIYADRKVWEPITLALGNVYLERKARAIANKHRYQEDVYYFAMEIEPLYAEPPAPVSVVLPEPKPRIAGYWHDLDLNDKIDDSFAKGWNACLDKFKELNQ